MLDVANIIWCSGFHPGLDWIDLPVFGQQGEVLHQAGIVESQPGLYFVGLTFPLRDVIVDDSRRGQGRGEDRKGDDADEARCSVQCALAWDGVRQQLGQLA